MKRYLIPLLFTFFIFAIPQKTEAQFLKKLQKSVEEKIEREADRRAQKRTDKAIDDAFDKAEDAIDGKSSENSDEQNSSSNKNGKSTSNSKEDDSDSTHQPNVVWSKFDFVPGDTVIFEDGPSTDYTTINGDLGIIYDDVNGGRLPYYHRLDITIKRKFEIGNNSTLETMLSITNVYDRQNIFYFDRIKYERVDQLPFLPSVGLNLSF